MKHTVKKFSLYIEVNGSIEYSVYPEPTTIRNSNGCVVYDFLIDTDKSNTVDIIVIKKNTPDSWIQIKRLEFNKIDIVDINSTVFFVTLNKIVKRNHGWANELGKFIIRLHGNAVSHNFLNYLFALTLTRK